MGTNVCLISKNLNQLNDAHQKCMEQGIPSVLIEDSGHIHPPHFDGSPIVTALGIGPCTRAQAKHITKKFEVYR